MPLQFLQLLDKAENHPKLSLALPDYRLNLPPSPSIGYFASSLSVPSCCTPSFDIEEIENPNRAELVPSPSVSIESSTLNLAVPRFFESIIPLELPVHFSEDIASPDFLNSDSASHLSFDWEVDLELLYSDKENREFRLLAATEENPHLG